MTVEYRPAVRKDASLLILLAGGTGAGKTESAMRLAAGLAGGKKFAVLDTENGRALHKTDDYDFDHASLEEPFTPERYIEAVKAADTAGYPVIVIDSGSHEYDGPGGLLDMQAEEFQRLGGTAKVSPQSWSEPKKRDRRYRQALITANAHVILCLRAEDKIEIVKKEGKTVIQPLSTIPGKSIDGWAPICEKRLPFEATISLLMTAGAPGVPKPIKLERRHEGLVPLDRQLDETVGFALAEWARGSSASAQPAAPADETPFVAGEAPEGVPAVEFVSEPQRKRLFAIASECGVDGPALKAVLLEFTGQESSAAIPRDKYDVIVAAVEARRVAA